MFIQGDDTPPVLEPIFPVEDNVDKKPQPKKRANKKPASPEEHKKLKVEDPVASEDSKQVATNKKNKVARKSKPDSPEESLEDVMKDLSSLITNNSTKQEVEEAAITGTPTEAVHKPKKYSKKQLDALKRKLLKKENIENTLKKIDLTTSNVIDMLDLNVQKLVSKPVKKRRHSIEKYPLGAFGAPNIAHSIFNNLPRSISPKAKRSSKIRQSVDTLSRRSSPYTTRSDSPARILRNGKHRKLKDLNLLEGLDIQYKRRRRLCSDLSGSELSVSKVSGYDSDSSFSDLSSLHGTESSDVKDTETKKEEMEGDCTVKNVIENVSQGGPKTNISNELPKNGATETDTNSNLYSDVKPAALTVKEPQGDNQNKDESATFENLAVSPSLKVPDKSIILNIMKQTFNFTETSASSAEESSVDKEKRATRASTRKSGRTVDDGAMTASKFYGNSESSKQLDEPKEQMPIVEEVKKEDVAEGEDRNIDVDMQEANLVPEPETVQSVEGIKPEEEDEAIEEANETKDEAVDETQETDDVLKKVEIAETPENLAKKEHILQALGLQSLKAAEEAKMKEKEKERSTRSDNNYTGTLKTVIKLNRCEKKKGKNSLKMTLQKNRGKGSDTDTAKTESDSGYKIMKEVGVCVDHISAMLNLPLF